MIKSKFQEAQELVEHLVSVGPWEKIQTHESLISYLFEEAYEFSEAVGINDQEEMKTELADLLLQVMLHAAIAKRNNNFDIESVSQALIDKISFRCREVLEGKVGDIETQLKLWEQHKQEEKALRANGK